MAKNMSNNDIVAYEGGDYGEIMDNYNLHEITAAIANRAGKAYNAFKSIEEEVERLENNPDVVDIVATYADLQAYQTSQLTDKDVIRVLQDETHDGDSTYYRWSTATQTWTYIGESKQYSDFVGTDGMAGGQNGLVPAPVATDAGKFLNANGSWEEIVAGGITELTTADYNWPTNNPDGIALWLLEPGVYYALSGVTIYPTTTPTDSFRNGGTAIVGELGSTVGTIVTFDSYHGNAYMYQINPSTGAKYAGKNLATTIDQTTGTSTTTVMSQNAVTSMIFADPGTERKVRIGTVLATGDYGISIGYSSQGNGNRAVAIGYGAKATATGSIALGVGSQSNTSGVMQISTNNALYGYNNSPYRLLTGLYDPQSAHDAANKEYVDNLIATLEARIAALEGN